MNRRPKLIWKKLNWLADPNGFSDVTIIIIGPDINHDDMVGKAFEGAAKGLLGK